MIPAIALSMIMFLVGVVAPLHAAKFDCSSGDVTCLIAAINTANGKSGKHTINLEPGVYTLQTPHNPITQIGLPSISRAILIQATADDPPTVIEREPGAPVFAFFTVELSGKLTLDGVTVERSGGAVTNGLAILNRGVTSLQNSVVTNSSEEITQRYTT